MAYHRRFDEIAFITFLIIGISIGYRVVAERTTRPTRVVLPVPVIMQVDDGVWKNPWANACEEASVVMVEAFYRGNTLTQVEAKNRMRELFSWENSVFGFNEDTGADLTIKMIASTSVFAARSVYAPSIDGIKNELREARPVIALIHQGEFYRRAISSAAAASFHMFVVVGFDDLTKVFFIADPADGSVRRYPYDRLMGALHDLDGYSEATGDPVVLYTSAFPND